MPLQVTCYKYSYIFFSDIEKNRYKNSSKSNFYLPSYLFEVEAHEFENHLF